MFKPRAAQLKRPKQGEKRAMRTGLELEWRPTVWTRRARIEKGVNLLLEEVALEGEGVWTRLGSTRDARCIGAFC